ncbi:nucleotidyl transferase AbiEii/AbiGii toxin family protein [candidate division KSB1 bacterium]|nr:nucleotidyl transferase AbiEii/AbiGii toxin family protein [candidate division KSB1 bacterium]
MATRFERTLQDIDKRCRKHKLPYAVIGGIAAIIHGSLRVTADIDLTILAEIDALERVLKIFANDYVALRPDPLRFFQRTLFIPLQHKATKMKVDIAAALSGFERAAIARSQRGLYGKAEVNTCTVEDLIIMKLVAARAKDISDVETLIPANRKQLDLKYLRARAKEFIEVERSDVPERLEKLLKKYRGK